MPPPAPLMLVAVTAVAALLSPPESPAPAASYTPGQAQSCSPPEPDRARAPAEDAPVLAVAPFRLSASRVDLHRVDLAASNRAVSVPTRRGSKRVLKMVVGAIEVTDLRLTTTPDGGAGLTLTTPAGSRSRLIGPITVYLEKLCGTLRVGPLGVGFGVPGAVLAPISAASPPPAVLPEVTFTDVTLYAAGFLGGNQLEVPDVVLAAAGA